MTLCYNSARFTQIDSSSTSSKLIVNIILLNPRNAETVGMLYLETIGKHSNKTYTSSV